MGRRSRDRSWPAPPEPLPAPLVDDHTHLETVLTTTGDEGWASGREGGGPPDVQHPAVLEHLARAASVGVTRLVQIGCDLPAVTWTDDAVRAHPALLGGVAIHPNEVVLHAGVREVAPDGLEPAPEEHHAVGLDEALARVEAVARGNDRIRVVGETGLDHFRAGPRGREVQREAFRAHIALAKELGLALQIHDRDAHAEVVEVLLADGAPERTVLHCFSGDRQMAEVCARQGWYLSFAGPVTYPSSDELRHALHVTPRDRLLLETDAPYLPAHPFRGRPNAPYLLPVTARAVAAELDVDLADLCRTVSATAEQVYGPW